MASTRRSKVTIVREYDTNNIDIEPKPAPKQEYTSDEVTVENEVKIEPLSNESKATTSTSTAETTSTTATKSTTQSTTNNNNIDIPIATPINNKGFYEIKNVNQKPMKIKITRGYDSSPNSKVIAVHGHPGFNGVQDDMEREMERRKLDWEKEVMKMQKEFFKISPGVMSMGSGTVATPGSIPTALGTEIIHVSNTKNIYETKPDGSKVYKVRFNCKGFKPNELSVRIEGRILRVTAKHEEEGDLGEKASKNFDRKMDLPDGVDADLLASELSSDGILCIEAPVNYVEEENKVIYNVKEEDDLKDHHRDYWQQIRDQHNQNQNQIENRNERHNINVDTGSFTIGDPFNAVSLKGEDRILTPSHRSTINEQQVALNNDWQQQQYQIQEQWEQKHKQEPLHQHHRHRELFPEAPKYYNPPPTTYKRTYQTAANYKPTNPFEDKKESFTPTKSYAPTSSYVQKKGVFTPALYNQQVELPSGFRPGTEETETEAVYHKGGFITGPASAFAGLALNQTSSESQTGGTDVFGGNNMFNSLAASFSPMFQTSSRTSKRGASHLEQINQNASKLKLKVDIGDEYLPEDIQVVVDGRFIHVKANHEQVTPTGRTAKREYNRAFDAPDDLDLDTLRAVLGPDGRLIVGASLTTNRDKYAALDSIQEDMPPDGTNVQVLY